MQPEATLRLTVNGADRELPQGSSVGDLLVLLGVPVLGVAVERNRVVVRRADHAACRLATGDQIEIVQFVGGG